MQPHRSPTLVPLNHTLRRAAFSCPQPKRFSRRKPARKMHASSAVRLYRRVPFVMPSVLLSIKRASTSRIDPRIAIQLILAMATLCAPAGLAAQETQPVATRPAGDVGKEFRQRFSQLQPTDVQGHYRLAEWCRQQGYYRLLFRQAKYVLKLDAKHEQARQLLRIARQNLSRHGGKKEGLTDTAPREARGGNAPSEYLTARDIQKLRFAEVQDLPLNMRDWRTASPLPREARQSRQETEFVKVVFKKGVLNDFLDAMSGNVDFSRREDRTQFLDLPPTRQFQLIRFHAGDRYANRIQIQSDPLVFRQFNKVLPVVMQGCGTAACHGSSTNKSFRLRASRLGSQANLYTNFLILNRITFGKEAVVNRGKPESSLLLDYGLPADYAKRVHATPIEPVFVRGLQDPKYQMILDWIRSLRMPYPRTNITLPGYPERPPPGSFLGGYGTSAPASD